MTDTHTNDERQRLEDQRARRANWRLWGPYLTERACGTVREDYSPDGEAWDYFEYFHADSGQGLGAAHQTGWSGLLANLVMRRYQKDIRPWSGIDSGEKPALIDEIA